MVKRNNYDLLKEVYIVVNRLEDKIDKRLTLLENEVEANTSFRYKILGVAGVLGALAGTLASIIWKEITGK